MNYLEEIKKAREDYETKVMQLATEHLNDFAVANNFTDDPFYLFAFTPGFNDGDPCTHNELYYTSSYEVKKEYVIYDGVAERTEIVPEEEKELRLELMKAIASFFQNTCGTDYKVIFEKKNGVWTTSVDEYDCGY